jgi:large conductance mechanosensitive channel
MGFVQDFKDFAFKGNLVDMAVGIVIGGASAAIVKSFIDNIVSPLIGAIMKVPDMSNWTTSIGETADGTPIVLKHGAFIQNVLDFVIMAFAVFVAIRVMARFMKKQEAVAAPPADIKLLTEIRDALVKQR